MVDDNLKFDTIIKEDHSAANPIRTVTKVSDSSSYNKPFMGFGQKQRFLILQSLVN
jgi:hypothetical protein